MIWIISTLSTDFLSHTVGIEYSRDLWEMLEKRFAGVSRANVHHLRQRLQNLVKGDLSMVSYLQQMKEIADGLGDAGHPRTDDDLVAYILAGLFEEYDSFVTSIETRREKVSSDELHGYLLGREAALLKRKLRSNSSGPTEPFPSIFLARKGHAANTCRKLGRLLNASGSSSSGPFTGYYANPQSATSSPSWIVDSGVTAHVTATNQHLQNSSPYTGSDSLQVGNACQALIQQLSEKFPVKDLGPLHYFLGLEVKRTASGLFLSQTKYACDLLQRTDFLGAKPCATPLGSYKLDNSGMLLSDPTFYRSTAGALQYLTWTRPDLSFAVNLVCQHLHQPRTNHLGAVKRILRYLKGSLDMGICFRKGPLVMQAYSDADCAGCPLDRRSTSGWCVFLGSNLISWSAKKQPNVSRSSTESEYRGIAMTAAELVYIAKLFKDIGF
ncbi:unnamed protein product, partial [Prunus brigantina]